MQKHFRSIESMTRVVPLDLALSLVAGETDFLMEEKNQKLAIADSIVYATSKMHGASVISGDPHFREELDGVFFL